MNVIFVIALLFAEVHVAAGEAEPDWDWAGLTYANALRKLLPLESDAEISVGMRVFQDSEMLEYSFVIEKNLTSNNLAATVRQAVGQSIWRQVQEASKRVDRPTAEEIFRTIQIREFRVNQEQCPAIRRQFQTFFRKKLDLPSPAVTHTHPIVHEFAINTGDGTLQASLLKHDHPFSVWADRTFHLLTKCGKTR